jgi:DNA processing protein
MDNEVTLLALINDKQEFKDKELIEFFSELSSIENFFTNPPDSIELRNNKKYSRISEKIKSINEFYSKINFTAYKDEIKRLENSGVNLITFNSEKYPVKLKDIPNPPFLLYHKGKLMNLNHCVAIVGTRNLSHYGHKRAREISGSIAKNGYTIVSGLARGTDTEAHCGALDVGGKTIAVLAGHIEDIFPKENLKLASDIMESGAILSEISTMGIIHKGRFIDRNRITSGISECLIVIESNGSGGTYHQVNWAIEQGCKVFVMKPLETDKQANQGFIEFIKLGAEPFDSLDVILNFLKVNKIDHLNFISKKNRIESQKITLEYFL